MAAMSRTLVLPSLVGSVVEPFAGLFTRPSYRRFVLLLVGTIVTLGRRTVSRVLWTLDFPDAGHPSSFHRFFSLARWSSFGVGKVLAAMVLEMIPEGQPVLCAIDDTVVEHTGDKVFGKGCHRDAVRSGHGTHTSYKWGHKWVVLAVLVPVPFAKRSWALPILCALYRSPKDAEPQHRHKTPCDLARGLAATLLRMFPDRRFVLIGDGGFASHDLALFCVRHREQLTLIVRSRPDLRLHALACGPYTPCRQTIWRHKTGKCKPQCRKGVKLPSPAKTVQAVRKHHKLPKAALPWYGQSVRELEFLSGCGGWYRGRGDGTAALVPVRWVYTHDPIGNRDDWFCCTDPTLSPATIVSIFARRWSIEVTFEEVRAHLGLGSTRQRCRRSVLRAAPCLLGLFSLVSVIFARLWERANRKVNPKDRPATKAAWLVRLHHTPCYYKTEPSFADALYAVRRALWDGCLLKHVTGERYDAMLPPNLRRLLITHLAEAA